MANGVTKFTGFGALLLAGWLSAIAVPAQQSEPAGESALAEARQIAGELTTELKQLLSAELAKGGFTGAVRVCSEKAQTISGTFNTARGAFARRVSLRYRNPNDRPDEFEAALLRQWEALEKGKRAPEEYSQVVTDDAGRKHLRYLKPIYIQAMCLTCHGQPAGIPEEVKQVLGERYPKDLATGYRIEDLRGAVSVKIPLNGE